MGYVGNQQAEGFVQRPTKQDLTGATGTSLTLTHAVSKEEDIDLYINNVKQEPTTAYTVADTAVTLTGSVVATDDIYVVYNSLALQTVVPPDGSVTSAKLVYPLTTFSSTGIDDNATSTAMTLDSSGNLLHGTTTSSGTGITVANDVWFQKSGYNDWKLTHYNGGFYFNNGTDRVVINSSGSLNATGGLQSLGVYNNTTGTGANLVVDSAGGFARSTSSMRYKNTITDAVHGLTELLALRPVTYKGNNNGDAIFGGLIAEEVHDAGLTEFVTYNDDGEPDALAYGNMVSLCIKAIQEQQATIQELEARIAALESA